MKRILRHHVMYDIVWTSEVHQLHTEVYSNIINKRFQRHQRARAETDYQLSVGTKTPHNDGIM